MEKVKNIFLLATIFAGANVASATDFVLSTNAATALPATNTSYDVYYTGASANNAMLGVAGETYNLQSLVFKAGGVSIPNTDSTSVTPKEWLTAGNFVIDINSAEGETIAIKNESTARLNFKNGTITIKNTATPSTAEDAISPVAVIDLGSNPKGLIAQVNFTLDIQTNSKITSSATGAWNECYLYNKMAVKVNNASTLTMDAVSSFGSGTNTPANQTFDVTNNSTVVFNKKAFFYSATVNVDSTSTLQLNAVSYFGNEDSASATKATIDGSLDLNDHMYIYNGASVVAKSFDHQNGAYVNVYGTLETQSTTSFANTEIFNGGVLKQTSGTETTVKRNFVVNNGAEFYTTGTVKLTAGTTDSTNSDKKWAYIQIDDGATFTIDNADARVIFNNGELILNKENAITNKAGEAIRLVTQANSKNNVVTINASQEFSASYVNESSMQYFLSDDASVTLKARFTAEGEGSKHVFHNFDENRIFVINANSFETVESINAMFEAYQTVNGEEVKIDQLYINNGWLSAINPAVPEPAEWAMILGSIALGLAIYRRRK